MLTLESHMVHSLWNPTIEIEFCMCQLILESWLRAKMNGHEFEHESMSELISEADTNMKTAFLGLRTRTQTRTNIGQA